MRVVDETDILDLQDCACQTVPTVAQLLQLPSDCKVLEWEKSSGLNNSKDIAVWKRHACYGCMLPNLSRVLNASYMRNLVYHC